jgi:micrococcal nuclease
MTKRGALWLVLLMAAGPAVAASGIVTHVTDGDTLWVRVDGASARSKPKKLRLQGIDAPESCQAWGPQAAEALGHRVLHRRVQFETVAQDGYHRSIARVSVDGDDVAAWMVAHGHAWGDHYKRRDGGRYAVLEAQAKAARRGLFAQPGAIEPRVFRRMHGSCKVGAH